MNSIMQCLSNTSELTDYFVANNYKANSQNTNIISNHIQIPESRMKNQTLKQRINNLVIKTLAENLEKDKHSAGGGSQHSPQNLSPVHLAGQNTNSGQNNTSTTANNYFIGDTWKIKIFQNTRVISTIKESMFVTDAILKFAENDKQVVVSVDCEGINLGVKGELTLIEVGTTKGEAFIFDILTCPEMVTDGGLKKLLEHDNVIKIIHDCRNDSINLYQQFGILLRNVFDTQVWISFKFFLINFVFNYYFYHFRLLMLFYNSKIMVNKFTKLNMYH